jgi:Mg-chelatase subunit ChlD/anti-sigma factor RsiW
MNPDQPSREQIETRITALLLGELPAEEAALLRYTIAQDPGMQQLHDELQSTLALVREAAKHPEEPADEKAAPLRLPAERRQQLLAHFKTPRPQTTSRQPLFWLKPIKVRPLIKILATVAIIAVLAAMLLPGLSSAKHKGQYASTLSSEPQQDILTRSGRDELQQPEPPTPATASPVVFARAEQSASANRPVMVTVAPEPKLAPPPKTIPSTKIVLPPPESAPELAVTTKAVDGGVYSESVVGYVNVPLTNGVPATVVPALERHDRLAEVEKLEEHEAPAPTGPSVEPESTVGPSAGLALNYTFNPGISGGGGGGGVSAAATTTTKSDVTRQAEVFKRSGSYNGYYTPQAGQEANILVPSATPPVSVTVPLNNDALAFGARATRPGVAGELSPSGDTFALNDTDVNYSLPVSREYTPTHRFPAANVLGLSQTTPLTATATATTPLPVPAAKPSLETYQELAQKKVPLLADLPVAGRLLQSSTSANTAIPPMAPPRQAAAAAETLTASGLDTQTSTATEKADLPARKLSPNAPVPQPEILTRSNAFSTFSLNVSDVSFKFAEASLQNNKLPDTAAIRSEEFINAFDYRDPEAAAGQPMAFTSERARYPFAHNRELLRFALKTAATGRPAGRALNLVLLLDVSGSMERADRVAIVHQALRVLATQVQPQDTVSVVTFARTAHLWADGLRGDQAGATLERVGGITPEGGTNLEEAMRLAYETAHRHYLPGGLNRIELLTDGAANLGSVEPESLKQKVEAQRRQGIALDCFGIGWEDYNDNLLELLSSHGDGRYAFLNSPEEAARDFGAKLAGALQIAAADVKVQVEFNPARVISYRQIGYATHQLSKEQFRDNTVAAGEIAAQEAGNALYTIQTSPGGEGPIATVRVRYRVPGTTEYREHSWQVPYTGNAPALERSDPALRLAATAGAFSEWLAASPYAQEVTPDALLRILSGVPGIYGADDRPKQLETMIREARSLAGQ